MVSKSQKIIAILVGLVAGVLLLRIPGTYFNFSSFQFSSSEAILLISKYPFAIFFPAFFLFWKAFAFFATAFLLGKKWPTFSWIWGIILVIPKVIYFLFEEIVFEVTQFISITTFLSDLLPAFIGGVTGGWLVAKRYKKRSDTKPVENLEKTQEIKQPVINIKKILLFTTILAAAETAKYYLLLFHLTGLIGIGDNRTPSVITAIIVVFLAYNFQERLTLRKEKIIFFATLWPILIHTFFPVGSTLLSTFPFINMLDPIGLALTYASALIVGVIPALYLLIMFPIRILSSTLYLLIAFLVVRIVEKKTKSKEESQ